MQQFIKFNTTYSVERLEADLAAAQSLASYHLHWSSVDHDGGWSAIPLVSSDGRVDDASLRVTVGNFQKTSILQKCPYLEEIVDSFDCPKQRVRLMAVEPGKNVHTHRDLGDCWAMGKVRLHIPIVTHPDVVFVLNGNRIVMNPGELWYLDFSRPHSIANRSPIRRIHFVLDLLVNDWLREFFPEESWRERVANAGRRLRTFVAKSTCANLSHLANASALSRIRRRRLQSKN